MASHVLGIYTNNLELLQIDSVSEVSVSMQATRMMKLKTLACLKSHIIISCYIICAIFANNSIEIMSLDSSSAKKLCMYITCQL